MGERHLTLCFLLACLSVVVAYEGSGLESITKPLVILPQNWYLATETSYPNAVSEYDPEGAGMMQYIDETDQDSVLINYEKAPAITWTNATLEMKASEILERDHPNALIVDSGTMTIAHVTAGYAKSYDSEYDAYGLETVFRKGSVFFNVYALYAATHYAEAQVTSLLNSIAVQEPTSISCLIEASNPETGEQVTIRGAIIPVCPDAPVRIIIRTPDGPTSAIAATTDSLGNYSTSYIPNRPGTWSFQASWDGNDVYKGAESSAAYLTIEIGIRENPPPYYVLAIVAGVLLVAASFLLFRKKRRFPKS
jgi:hypothetical protein